MEHSDYTTKRSKLKSATSKWSNFEEGFIYTIYQTSYSYFLFN